MPNHIDYNNNLSRFESAKRQVRPLHYTSLSHHIPVEEPKRCAAMMK